MNSVGIAESKLLESLHGAEGADCQVLPRWSNLEVSPLSITEGISFEGHAGMCGLDG